MYHFLKIDLTKEIDVFSFLDLAQKVDQEVYEVTDDPVRQHADIVFSSDKEFVRKYKFTYKLEPRIKIKHKKVLSKIAEKTGYEHEELILGLLNEDVFADIAVFNKLSYKELSQLLAAVIAYDAQTELQKKELIVMFDDAGWNDFAYYSITHIVDQHMLGLPVPNMLSLPNFAAFAQKLKGYR